MGNVPFDTLQLAQTLEACGFPRGQAVGAAQALAEAVSAIGDALFTRDHLDVRLAELAGKLERRLADVRLDLVKWMVGLFLGQTAVLSAAMKLL